MLKEQRKYALKVLRTKNVCHTIDSEHTKETNRFVGYTLYADRLPKKIKDKGYYFSKNTNVEGLKEVCAPSYPCTKTYGCTNNCCCA